MEAGSEAVWYAAYGSNLDRARFHCYVAGGRPAGATRTYPGCRDRTPPRRESAADVGHGLYFAGSSSVWGGAVAFVEVSAAAPTPTHVRLYLLTWEQFGEVHAQDNRGGSTDGALPTIATLRSESAVVVGSGWYDTVVHLGDHDGLPVLTFTASDRAVVGDAAAPTDAYAATMARGLADSHGLSPAQAARYVAAAPGAAGRVREDHLAELFSRPL